MDGEFCSLKTFVQVALFRVGKRFLQGPASTCLGLCWPWSGLQLLRPATVTGKQRRTAWEWEDVAGTSFALFAEAGRGSDLA